MRVAFTLSAAHLGQWGGHDRPAPKPVAVAIDGAAGVAEDRFALFSNCDNAAGETGEMVAICLSMLCVTKCSLGSSGRQICGSVGQRMRADRRARGGGRTARLEPVIRISVQDTFAQSGETEELFDFYGMTPAHIVAAARKAMELRDSM